jgi:hypothetical protein
VFPERETAVGDGEMAVEKKGGWCDIFAPFADFQPHYALLWRFLSR